MMWSWTTWPKLSNKVTCTDICKWMRFAYLYIINEWYRHIQGIRYCQASPISHESISEIEACYRDVEISSVTQFGCIYILWLWTGESSYPTRVLVFVGVFSCCATIQFFQFFYWCSSWFGVIKHWLEKY